MCSLFDFGSVDWAAVVCFAAGAGRFLFFIGILFLMIVGAFKWRTGDSISGDVVRPVFWGGIGCLIFGAMLWGAAHFQAAKMGVDLKAAQQQKAVKSAIKVNVDVDNTLTEALLGIQEQLKEISNKLDKQEE